MRYMAFVGEYAEENMLTVYVLRRGIADPSDFDLQQATEAIRSCNRLGLWAVLSRGVHMRVVLPERIAGQPSGPGCTSKLPRGPGPGV